jgi:hypothetical protein
MRLAKIFEKHEEFLIFSLLLVVAFSNPHSSDEKRNLFVEASDRAPECDR